ncbi:beta clamp domain-containing protein [Paraburkholderia aspalathi]|uniref:hypothetical protein n=1 Tax=Paraburkholderia aspalathi TaxID=1324617 RepID=UPI00190AD2B0|nr:hypothetical protein [Paraburkholderia aspalathi]MBK3841759.1 hypothetical protein [Paraburkholderia aspalathi]
MKRVGPSVDRRSVLAVRQCVRIRVDGKSFEMIAACEYGQATYREERLGDAAKTLDVCVPADRLAPALGVASEYVDIDVQKNGRIKLSTGTYKVTVSVFQGEDFPLVTTEGSPIADIDVVGLSGLVSSVAFAADTKDIREFCRGVMLESDGKQLTATATNGNILATAQITTSAPAFGVLLHAHAAELLIEMDPKRLVVASSHVTAFNDGAELILKPMAQKVVDWRRTLPALKNAVSFDAAPLREAVSMHRYYGDKVGAVRFTTEGTECALEVMNSEDGANVDLDVFDVVGDADFSFTFRGDQLAQILTRAPAEKITFYWDAAKPRAFLVQNGNWRGVVSPLIV